MKFIPKILLFLIVLGFANNMLGQSFLSTPIQKDYSQHTIYEFFQDIESEFNVIFFYKSSWLGDDKLEVKSNRFTYEKYLYRVLKKYDLDYIAIQGTSIILVPSGYTHMIESDKTSIVKVIGNPLEKGKYALNEVEGHVYFGKTGEPIIGAVVVDKKTNRQTATDYTGYYSVKLPIGRTQLEFSFIGLEKNIIEVDVMSPGTLDCNLMEAPIAIDAVNVVANGGRSNVERTQMGLVHMEIKSMAKLPVLMGEADIVKTMTLLPGVQSTGEMSAGFNVRGGNVDQNQILIDGAPIYNTSHLFGLFSALIPSAVSDVNFHKGTQPANYGGRLSSVMEIGLKDADTARIKGKAGIGTLNSSIFVEGPVSGDFCTFSFGARTTYSNWLLKYVPDADIKNSETNFYDLIGKVDFKFNRRNQLGVFAYYSSDFFNYAGENTFAYKSLVSGLNYRLYMNQLMSMNLNVSYSDYKNDLSAIDDPYQAYTVASGINQLSGKLEFKLHLYNNDVSFGVESNLYTINPGIKTKYNEESTIIPETINEENALDYAIFIQDNFSITDKLSLLVGLRYSWYSVYGPSESLVYDPNQPVSENSVTDTLSVGDGEFLHPYNGIEPRIGIKYGFNDESSVKAGYHMSRQYQHLISNASATTPSDYWKSADNNIKPMTSTQYSLGYFRNFKQNVIEASAELYYKEIDNTLVYRNGAVLIMNPAIEQDMLAGETRAYGFEFMLKKNSGRLNGWLSYTISKSESKVTGKFPGDDINEGNYFPTYNDRLHDLSISLNYQLTRRWNFAGNFIYTSGRPVTYPEMKYEYRERQVVYFSERNKYRLPAYHRLDIGLTYEGNLKKTKMVHPSFTLGIYNLYGHSNVYSVYYKSDVPSSRNDYNRFGLYELSIIGVPIPSLTINLSF